MCLRTVHARIQVFLAVLKYVEAVLSVARPRRLLFLAVDGPAPRAKMNQQRSRRFKSAAEAEEKEAIEKALREEWRAAGRPLPPESGADVEGAPSASALAHAAVLVTALSTAHSR
eukprot:725680-Pleurochrysis_carterae.AAC.2